MKINFEDIIEISSKSVLDPGHYTSKDVYQKEIDSIFNDWLLAARLDELPNNGDSLTIDIAGVEIILANDGDQINAFYNKCPHRGTKLRELGYSNSPIKCPYHSWVFHQNGDIKSIPKKITNFENDDCRGLYRVCCERVGNFIFIALNPSEKIEDFLGDLVYLFHHISNEFDVEREGKYKWNANWKIAVESVLEVYHVNSVHPNTFKNFIESGWDCGVSGRHSYGRSVLADDVEKWWDNVNKRLNLTPSSLYKNYDHFLVFPNIAIGITRGTMLSIQTYLPVSPKKTILKSAIFLPKNQHNMSGIKKLAINDAWDFNDKVLSEDQQISELVQQGIKFNNEKSTYGKKESRIYHFHESVMNAVT